MKKQHNIPTGLFGFGTVNEGLYELLEKTNNHSLDIQKIVVKNKDKVRKIGMAGSATTRMISWKIKKFNW